MSDSVQFAAAGGIATLTLNRPRAMNALDAAMIVHCACLYTDLFLE